MSIEKFGNTYVVTVGNVIVMSSDRLKAMHAAAATILK